jgi:hypothetical protein
VSIINSQLSRYFPGADSGKIGFSGCSVAAAEYRCCHFKGRAEINPKAADAYATLQGKVLLSREHKTLINAALSMATPSRVFEECIRVCQA